MHFKRGIYSTEFRDALEKLAGIDGWWHDVLIDNSLIIGIRDEYLNVYWQGQSIFKVSFKAGKVTASTHEKYLLNPDLKGQVSLIDGAFSFGKSTERMLIQNYEGPETLAKLKRSSGVYSGKEKEGVHKIATFNNSIVDVEIALSAAHIPEVGTLPRIDLANFEQGASAIDLIFWEAKTFSNSELKSLSVVKQIKKYQTVISDTNFRSQIRNSYQQVAENLVNIENWSNGARKMHPTIHAVANRADLHVSEKNIGLIVYGFNAPESSAKDSTGRTRKERVTEALGEIGIGGDRIKFKGSTDEFHL